jgi:hypothetical protein
MRSEKGEDGMTWIKEREVFIVGTVKPIPGEVKN